MRPAHVFALVSMLVAGLLLGVLATSTVLGSRLTPGLLTLGPWSVWHRAGAPDADPYSLAVFARRGDVPMTPVEGMALFAERDEAGAELRADCSYEIRGAFPQARAWTLTTYNPDGSLLRGPSGRASFNSSEALVEGPQIRVALSPRPRPGNWLPIGGGGRFTVVLRLYETPLTAIATALDASRLPALARTGCGA